MEIIIGIVCFIVGGGIGFGISKATEKQDVVVEDKTSQAQQEVIKNLTNLDLIIPLCDPKKQDKDMIWDSTQQADMCRYLACLQFSRGVDSKTGGNGECEQISNIMNKKAVLEHCKKEEDPDKSKACVEFFDRRL